MEPALPNARGILHRAIGQTAIGADIAAAVHQTTQRQEVAHIPIANLDDD